MQLGRLCAYKIKEYYHSFVLLHPLSEKNRVLMYITQAYVFNDKEQNFFECKEQNE